MALDLKHSNINIVDIGAMSLGDEREPYRPLLNAGKASVVGFEPNEQECAKLNAQAGRGRYYPNFIGDGGERTFYETNFAMTGSLYKPNTALLEKFVHLNELTQLVKEHKVQTHRLDDLAGNEGLSDVDLIKIDVQGAELDVFRGAARALNSAVMIITEVEFVELYQGQPLYSDVDKFLRGYGFQFHTFLGFGQRFFKPFNAPKNPGAAFRQFLWSDAVFVKDFMHFDRLTDDKLVKLAVILDGVVRSYDLAGLALAEYDRRHSTTHAVDYVASIVERHATAGKARAL